MKELCLRPSDSRAHTSPAPHISIPEECSMCFHSFDEVNTERYTTKELPRYLYCGHIFGSHCIKEWLSDGSRTCPICRRVQRHRCGHTVQARVVYKTNKYRQILMPPKKIVEGKVVLPKLTDYCLKCYFTKNSGQLRAQDPNLVALNKSMSRILAIEILHTMVLMNWKNVNTSGSAVDQIGSISWVTVFKELVRRFRPPDTASQSKWVSAMNTPEQRKLEKQRFLTFIDAIEGSKLVKPAAVCQAWCDEKIFRPTYLISRLERMRLRFHEEYAAEEAKLKERWLLKMMTERW